MSCDIGYNIGMMLCGWLIGVVGVTFFFVLITGLCIKCSKKTTLDSIKEYFNVWWFYLTIILILVISLTIVLIVGGLVCFKTGQAIGYGALISSQTFNLFYHLGFSLLNWYFRGRHSKDDCGNNACEKNSNEEKNQPI